MMNAKSGFRRSSCPNLGGEADVERLVRLAYCRVGGKFTIAVKTETRNSRKGGLVEPNEVVPLGSAPREMKLRAFEKLPNFWRKSQRKRQMWPKGLPQYPRLFSSCLTFWVRRIS